MSTNRLSAQARREQILDVAIDVFAPAGYHGASMNDIAEAAGVTKPVLYQHFDSKQDLYLALLAEVGGRMLGAITAAQSDATNGRELTEYGFRAYFRWVANRPDEFSLLYGGSARNNADFANYLKGFVDDVAESIVPLIDVDLDRERRQTLAHGLIGMAESASRYLVSSGREFDPDEIARDLSSLAWAGLRAVDRSSGHT